MSYKVINISNPGTSVKFGGDDLDLIAKTLNGQVAGLPPVKLMNQNKVTVGDNILQLLNPAETHVMRLRTPAFDHDIDVYIPDTDDNILTLLATDSPNTFEVEQTYESFQLLKRISEPSNPPSGYLVFWADSGGTTKVKDENGDIMTIMASVAGAINVGGQIGTYHSMSSNTLQFKSIQSSDASLIIDNTTDTQIIDFSLDLSEVDLQDLGGTLSNSQLAQITDTAKLPSATMYTNTAETVTATHTHNNGLIIGNISDPGNAPTDKIVLWSEDSLKFNDDQGTTFLTGGEEPTEKGTLWKSDSNNVMRAFAVGDAGQVIAVNEAGDDLEYTTLDLGGAGIPGDLQSGGRQWGWYTGVVPTVGHGFLDGQVSVSGTAAVYIGTTYGIGVRLTGVDGGNDTTLRFCVSTLLFRKRWNPIIEFDIRCPTTTDERIWACFHSDSGAAYNSDSELDDDSGFGIFKTLSGSYFQVIRNDGNASQELSQNVLSVSTTAHHVKIELSNSPDQGVVTIDGTTSYTFTNTSYRIPATDTGLLFVFAIEESGASSDRYVDIYNVKVSFAIP